MELLGPINRFVEVQQRADVGGGRGVFAKVDVQAGTLLLQEHPIVKPLESQEPGETLHMAVARALLEGEHKERAARLARISPLHPVSLNDLPSDVLALVSEDHEADVRTLRAWLAAQAGAETTTAMTDDELLRVLLVVRFNAHYSGLYVASEMFNHTCNANCIKLATPSGSEVRATRDIPAGTEVSISYLSPPLQSAPRRAAQLRTQHFFVPATALGPGPAEQGFYPAQLESCSMSAEGCTEEGTGPVGDAQVHPAYSAQLQAELDELEQQLDSCERAVMEASAASAASLSALTAKQRHAGRAGQAGSDGAGAMQPHADLAAALATACSLQRRLAAVGLKPRHIVLARAYDLIVIAASALLPAVLQHQPPTSKQAQAQTAEQELEKDPSFFGIPLNLQLTRPAPSSAAAAAPPAATATPAPPTSQPAAPAKPALPPPHPTPAVRLALCVLAAATELLATQELYGGPLHYDVARSLLDMQQALSWLMGVAPKVLEAAFPEYSSFAKASRAEMHLRKRHQQLSALYSS